MRSSSRSQVEGKQIIGASLGMTEIQMMQALQGDLGTY